MITFILICVTLAIIYFYIFEWKYKYWQRYGIPFVKPKFPFGTMKIGGEKHLGYHLLDDYLKLKNKGPIFGWYRLLEPVIVVSDPKLAKDILIKDFKSFHSRGLYENRRDEPMISHLFILSGQQWKQMRDKLTPVFTSGKMKYMMPTILNVAQELVNAMSDEMKIDSCLDMKEWMARFTTDVIGTCAFGIECNSLRNPDAKFREMGRRVLDFGLNFKRVIFGQNFPKFAKLIRMKVLSSNIREFFFGVIKETLEYRDQNKVKRNDFIDLLLQMWNKNKTNDEKDWDMDGLSTWEIAAQAFVFFLAGFESSSNALSYTLLEFAKNMDIQNKARDHVREIIKKNGDKITYEMLQELDYLDQCLLENLRKSPLGPFVFRVANENYPVPNTNYTIYKGQSVFIPLLGYQLDPEYYPNPDEYKPERFETKESRNSQVFMPFGDGQRICIGERFAKMEIKLALTLLLMNFEFSLSEKTVYPPVLNTNVPIMAIKEGLYLNVKKLK
uniref:CSON002647 protein n=1 Tax=Culicoides sonorensis TaxID=179676 RepID=A0A336L3W3_CULSO